MACGTGKTFTSLRIAERIVSDGERILFAAPTVALVSQARREWLRQTTRRLECIVVCSDPTAGGRNENEDIRVSELECPVTTDPLEDRAIAQWPRERGDPCRVLHLPLPGAGDRSPDAS
jgi:predicted helicase